MPVTTNRTPASPMTAAGTSLASPATAGTNIASPAVTSNTPNAALVEPGGDVYVVSPTTAHVPVSTPMPVTATGSRARKPRTEAKLQRHGRGDRGDRRDPGLVRRDPAQLHGAERRRGQHQREETQRQGRRHRPQDHPGARLLNGSVRQDLGRGLLELRVRPPRHPQRLRVAPLGEVEQLLFFAPWAPWASSSQSSEAPDASR